MTTSSHVRLRGRVSRFMNEHGFGWIRFDDTEEIFVHVRKCQNVIPPNYLRPGDPVTFEREFDQWSGRDRAVRVIRLDW